MQLMNLEDVIIFHQHRIPTKKGSPKNDLVARCYQLYLTGKSVRWIAKKYLEGKTTHQALYDMFLVRRYRLRKKKLKPAKVYKGITYRMSAHGGYRSRVGGVTVYLHQLIWKENNGPIPPDHYIIFKDGDSSNIVIENMKLMKAAEAKKLYNYANQNGYKRFPDKGAFGL